MDEWNHSRFDTFAAWLSDNLRRLAADYVSAVPEDREDCVAAALRQTEQLAALPYAKRQYADSGFLRYCWSKFCSMEGDAQAYERDVRDAADNLDYLRTQSHRW